MQILFSRFSAIAMAIGALWLVSPAMAAETIGGAVGVTPDAMGTVSGELGVNAPIYRDETVRTGPTGILEILFFDQTRLQLGSSSSVKLDRFVYAGKGKVRDMVVILSRGMFRFETGVSPKRAYWIQTPFAGVGVRGTDFTGEITPGHVRLTLNDGAIVICPIKKGESADKARNRVCPTVLTRPGQTASVDENGNIAIGGPPVAVSGGCAQTGKKSRLCSAVFDDRQERQPAALSERNSAPVDGFGG